MSCFQSPNPFPHIDAFWHLCSRRLFENIVTKEEIAQNKQFLLLPQCFPLLVIGCLFNIRDFYIFWQNIIKVVCCRIVVWGKGLKPLPLNCIHIYSLLIFKNQYAYTILAATARGHLKTILVPIWFNHALFSLYSYWDGCVNDFQITNSFLKRRWRCVYPTF